MNNKILLRLAYDEILKKIKTWFYLGTNLTDEANQFIEEWLIPKYKRWINDNFDTFENDLFMLNVGPDDIDNYVDVYWRYEEDFILDEWNDITQYLAKNINVTVEEINKYRHRLNDNIAYMLFEKQVVQHDANIKELLTNSVKNRLAQFNKITGKQYTDESLMEKLSNLICGTIYIQLDKTIPKAITLSRRRNGSYDVERGTQLALDELLAQPIITDEFCRDHFNCSLKEFNKYGKNTQSVQGFILNKDWDELFDYFYDKVDQALLEITNNARAKRNQYLLELDNDDKIGQFYGEIDYDPHNLRFRDAPIVVWKDFSNNGEDKVLIGKYGEFHIECISRVDRTIREKSKGYISECYYYKPCAFIDTTNGKYSIDEVAQILKNDSRIEKVFLSPGIRGGKLKRLAKLLF